MTAPKPSTPLGHAFVPHGEGGFCTATGDMCHHHNAGGWLDCKLPAAAHDAPTVPPEQRMAEITLEALKDLPVEEQERRIAAFERAVPPAPERMMLYRSKVERVRWPLIFMATLKSVPPRTMFRSADRRRS